MRSTGAPSQSPWRWRRRGPRSSRRELDIGALRWCVAALGVAIAGRLAWEPRVVGEALGATPVFNWLLFGYGAPAAAFALAARFMRQRAEDTPVRVADALTVLLSVSLVFFEIRHAMNGGDPYAPGSRLIEQALFAVSSFGFAIVLTRLDAARGNVVSERLIGRRGAGHRAGCVGFVAALQSAPRRPPRRGRRNFERACPWLSHSRAACRTAGFLCATRAPALVLGGAGALGGALLLFYGALQVRLFFHGPSIGFEEGAGVAEVGVDVCLCLTLAIGLLLRGPGTKTDLGVRGSMAFAALAAASRRHRAGGSPIRS